MFWMVADSILGCFANMMMAIPSKSLFKNCFNEDLIRLGHTLFVVVCVDEQKSAKKYFTRTFISELHPVSTALDLNNVSYPPCKKSNYTYLVQQNSVLPHPPGNHWPAQPPHTFDTWVRSQLENRREESASSLCWLPRRSRSTAATSVFVLLPVSCSLMCDRLNLVVYARLDWSHMRGRILTVYFEID